MSPAKAVGKIIGFVCALPHLLGYALGSVVLGKDRAFLSASERIARAPGMLGVYTRQVFYAATLQHVGKDVYFGFMSVFSKRRAQLGDGAYIGRFCSIGWAKIGPRVMLADGVQILSGRHQHSGDAPTRQENQQTFTPVTIGQGAWLGAGAVVMADVGDHALVAAGAVVVKPVAERAKVGGVPAKELRS